MDKQMTVSKAGAAGKTTVKQPGQMSTADERRVVKETEENGGGRSDAKMAEAGEAAKVMAERGEVPLDNTRELVAFVEAEGESTISILELLRAVEQTCGRVLGCRSKARRSGS